MLFEEGVRIAAEQGDADAQFNLGVLYKNGRGVAVDAVKAALWFRLAADQGHASAQFSLGCGAGLAAARPLWLRPGRT